MRTSELERHTFLLLLVAVTIAFLALLIPFFGAVMWAVALAMLFHPLYRRVVKALRHRRSVAALLTVLIVLFLVILPITFVVAALIADVVELAARLRSGELNIGRMFEQILAAAPSGVTNLLTRFGLGDTAALQAKVQGMAGQVSQIAATRALAFGQNTFAFLISFGVMVYLMFFMLRDGAALSKTVREAIPLARSRSHYLLNKFTIVTRATIKGNVTVASVQGALGGIAFAVLGVQGAVLWGVLMAFLSLIPAVGGAIIWVPVALYLLATGALWKALALTVFCVLVVGLVDNLLRPILVGKETKMPDYVVLMSTLGGIALFGINGFVIGPVIAALFMTAWTIFNESEEEHTPSKQTP